jgi:hypothetical protein
VKKRLEKAKPQEFGEPSEMTPCKNAMRWNRLREVVLQAYELSLQPGFMHDRDVHNNSLECKRMASESS